MKISKGIVFNCDICGAEITILNDAEGDFTPKCCNKLMKSQKNKLLFYHCDVCGSELAVLEKGSGDFLPKCCNQDMKEY